MKYALVGDHVGPLSSFGLFGMELEETISGLERETYSGANQAVQSLRKEEHGIILIDPRIAPRTIEEYAAGELGTDHFRGMPREGVTDYYKIGLRAIELIREQGASKDSLIVAVPLFLDNAGAPPREKYNEVGVDLVYDGLNYELPKATREIAQLFATKK